MRPKQVPGEEGLRRPHAAEEAVGTEQRCGQRPAAGAAAGSPGGAPRRPPPVRVLHAGPGQAGGAPGARGAPGAGGAGGRRVPVTSRDEAPAPARGAAPHADWPACGGRGHAPLSDWAVHPVGGAGSRAREGWGRVEVPEGRSFAELRLLPFLRGRCEPALETCSHRERSLPPVPTLLRLSRSGRVRPLAAAACFPFARQELESLLWFNKAAPCCSTRRNKTISFEVII